MAKKKNNSEPKTQPHEADPVEMMEEGQSEAPHEVEEVLGEQPEIESDPKDPMHDHPKYAKFKK